ncbi:MAG: protein kinase [Bryobacteraceae bacterium]|nr:protein kinase [Bryobacteraceae bacterium]
MVGATVSHYRITGELGSGGMGVVYAAEDLVLHRTVAIKFAGAGGTGDSLRNRLLEEARSASALDHPNIARIYDCGEAPDGRLFVVMERVRGETLQTLLHAGPLPVAKAARIAEDVLAALSEAHRAGVIHRDIKPSNVMVDERGVVKVLDFGLAKRRLTARASAAGVSPDEIETVAMESPPDLTHPGQVVGTPSYMSPEHVRNEAVDGRGDVFSASCLLHACLTGHSPFRGRTSAEVMGEVLHVTPKPPSALAPEVPIALDRIVLRGLEKDRERRYQTADEMRTDLAAFRQNLSGTSGLDAIARPKPNFRLPRWAWAAALAGVAAIAAWFAIPAGDGPSPEARRWYELGLGALRDGTYYNAQSALSRAVAADDSFALGHARLAEAWAELDSVERAQREMLLALRQPPGFRRRSASSRLTVEAIQASIARDLPGAVAKYRQLVDAVPERDRAGAWLDLGRAQERANATADAVASYTKALELDAQYAAAFLRRGVLLGQRGKAAESEKDLAQAQSIYEASRNLEGVAEVEYQRGVRLAVRGQTAAARAALERSRKLAADYSNEYQRLRAELRLSVVTYLEGDSEGAQTIARAAAAKAREARLPSLTVRGWVDLASAQLMKLDLLPAEENARQALELANSEGLARGEAGARLTLGSVLVQGGKRDEALPHLTAALDFFDKGQFTAEVGLCQRLLGRVYRSRGDFAKVHEILDAQMKAAEAAGDAAQVSGLWGDIAALYLTEERYADAQRALDRGIEFAEKSKLTNDSGYRLASRAGLAARLGELERARASLAALRAKAAGIDTLAAPTAALEREISFYAGEWAACAKAYRDALAKPGVSAPNEIQYRSFLAVALLRLGTIEEARREAARMLELAEKSKDDGAIARAKLLVAQSDLVARRFAPALDHAASAAKTFSARKQYDSLWRAETVASEAASAVSDPSTAGHRAAALDAWRVFETLNGIEITNRYRETPVMSYFAKLRSRP